MILSTHAIVGGAIGRLLPNNPILAFFLGFLSHLLTDAIPHWHYPVRSRILDEENPLNNNMVVGKDFLFDVAVIGAECLLGMGVAIYFFHNRLALDQGMISIIAGAVGGVIPDPLQFIYWKMPNKLLMKLQIFHLWIHSETDIDEHHLFGIAAQAVFCGIIIWLANLIA